MLAVSLDLSCLPRWAFDVRIRTKDATIAGAWPQHRVTTHTFVKELARVGWYLCTLNVTALWARQDPRSNAHVSSEGSGFLIN